MEYKVIFDENSASFDVNFASVQQVGGTVIRTDETLSYVNGILSVNTADVVEEDNTLPVTSAAVFAEVGNINALLETI